MRPFELLGLDPDADEAAIKRAYARLLKATRPDDDPAGFQRLNEAYRTALSHAREGPQDWDEDWEAEPSSAKEIAELSVPQSNAGTDPLPWAPEDPASDSEPAVPGLEGRQIHFDFDAFYAEALRQARAGNEKTLASWLEAHEDLYHLGLKHAVGSAFFSRLEHDPIALPPGRVEVFCKFFGLPHDIWWAQRMAVRWAIDQEATAPYGEPRPLALRELRRPFSVWRAMLVSCVPGLSRRIANLGMRLSRDYGALPEQIDVEQQEFFQRLAAADYFGKWRWPPILLRSLLAGLLGMVAALYLLTTGVEFSADVALPQLFLRAFAIGGTGALALQVGLRCFVCLYSLSHGWRARDQTWRALLPLWLGLGALVADWMLPSNHWLAYALVIPAALLHWRLTFDAFRFFLGGLWMFPALAGLTETLSQGIVGFAMVPICVALFDGVYARNHGIPLAAAVGNRWTSTASYVFFVGWALYSVARYF